MRPSTIGEEGFGAITADCRLGMIWVQTRSGVIGADGGTPWHLPEDLARFREMTTGHPVIMGRRTWESFPEKYRPLPGRTNIVVTTNDALREPLAGAGAVVASGFGDALVRAAQSEGAEMIWMIGGSELFQRAVHLVTVAEITVIDSAASGDTFAPALEHPWRRVAVDPFGGWHTSAAGVRYRFERWEAG